MKYNKKTYNNLLMNDKNEPKPIKGISLSYECRVGNCPTCNKFIREKEHPISCICGQLVKWEI